MSYGLLLIRVVFGLSLAGHGVQKLFGWFEGPGLQGTAAGFSRLRYRTPRLIALAAGIAETAGVLFGAGLVTPLAALAMAVVMLNAIATVHWPKGFWLSKGGYEYNLAILAVALGVTVTGPGRLSVDALMGWDNFAGPWWGVGLAVAAAVISLATLTLGRTRPGAVQESSEQRSRP